jgi:adenine phosphoribosyltransferase
MNTGARSRGLVGILLAVADLVTELVSRFRWIDGHADIWPLFADANLFRRLATALADPFRRESISKVAGVEARGFILGTAVALELGSGFVPVRKPGGLLPGPMRTSTTLRDYRDAQTELRLQRQSLTSRDRVLLVDDWCETGSQALTARELIEGSGSMFVGISVIVDQLAPPMRARLSRFEALVPYDALREAR